MPFTIVRQDITKIKVDAIVNSANTDLIASGGLSADIFKAAGKSEMQNACEKLAPIKTGESVITPGFALPCKFVIHAAGPFYRNWGETQSEKFLRAAYLSSLTLAATNKATSIALPLISSGIYGYPKDAAQRIATDVIREFLRDHDIDVYLALYNKEEIAVDENLLGKVDSYVNYNYVEKLRTKKPSCDYIEEVSFAKAIPQKKIKDIIEKLDEPFSVILLQLIDAKGKMDVEVYKRANLDRKLFSKIRTGKEYKPSKRTIIALAVALEFNLEETSDLLKRAGFALSHSQKFDVIVEYFIIHRKYSAMPDDWNREIQRDFKKRGKRK